MGHLALSLISTPSPISALPLAAKSKLLPKVLHQIIINDKYA